MRGVHLMNLELSVGSARNCSTMACRNAWSRRQSPSQGRTLPRSSATICCTWPSLRRTPGYLPSRRRYLQILAVV